MKNSPRLIAAILASFIFHAHSAKLPGEEGKINVGGLIVKHTITPFTSSIRICQNDEGETSMCSGGGMTENWYFDWGFASLDGISTQALVSLDRVEIFGHRECGLTIQGKRTKSVNCNVGDLLSGPIGMSGADKAALGPIIEEILKPAPKLAACVRVTTPLVPSVDEDRRISGGGGHYYAATTAFEKQYAGELKTIETGSRVDVKYTTGNVVTFKVSNTLAARELISPYFENFDSPSPCK